MDDNPLRDPSYQWINTDIDAVPYLARFKSSLGSTVSVYAATGQKPLSRKAQDGVWLFTAMLHGQKVAFFWNDFRVSGGSFGKKNVDRMLSFLIQTSKAKLPLIVGVNSMGVKISEGRTLFDRAFSLIPALESYKQSAKVYTVATGNCFGLGAILFGLGHYRYAIREDAKINLTGPEVFSLFFGKAIEFDELASVDNQNKRTGLVSEVVSGLDEALDKTYQLVAFEQDREHRLLPESYRSNAELGLPQTVATPESHKAAYLFVASFCDGFMRLFRTFDDKLLVFLARIGNKRLGILINPPGNTDNMIGERTLELYKEALLYFRALEVPVLSVLDTPGADPRVQANNYRILEKMIEVARLIYNYPFNKMGIGYGRCFGGACLLAIPKIFGGKAAYTIKGTELGIMHPDIITQLLSGSKRLLNEWQQNQALQTEDLSDMVKEGSVDKVITIDQLRDTVTTTLFADALTADEAVIDAERKYLPKIYRPLPHEKQGGHLV